MLAMFWTFGFISSFHVLLMPYLKEAMQKMGTYFFFNIDLAI